MEHGPISFWDWQQAPARKGLEPRLRVDYERASIAFVRHCKAARLPVTAQIARQHLVQREWRAQPLGRTQSAKRVTYYITPFPL